MGTKAGTNINREGLVLHLDFANPKCYPGTGSYIYNLGSGKASTTFATIYWSNDFGGVMNFPGTTALAFGRGSDWFPLSSGLTLEAVIKTPGLGDGNSINGIIGGTYGIRLNIASSGLLYWGLDNIRVERAYYKYTTSPNLHDDKWHHILSTNDGNYTRIYIDGVLKYEEVHEFYGTTRWPTNPFNIGRDNNNSGYFFNGMMSIVKMYNRALSEVECRQSYENIKGRFNI